MIRTLIAHPLDISYSSYQYINALAKALKPHNVEISILAPHHNGATLPRSETPYFQIINMIFENGLLHKSTKRAINKFDPDIVHAWSPREMVARASLEAVIGTGAKLIVNYEDPEHFHFDTLTGATKASSVLRHVDKAFITAQDIESFIRELNWHSLWKGLSTQPHSGQFINPLFYAALNNLAAGFTGIWHPWVDLLKERFRKPTLLMPYSVDFSAMPASKETADNWLIREKLKIPTDATVFLRSGMIYAIVNDQETLFASFAKCIRHRPNSILIICGGDGDAALTEVLIDKYELSANVRRLGFLSDKDYKAVMDTADICLCPGYPDDYNRYRLAMKIIEYMVLGKPMICYASGIGESLINGEDALLLDEYTPERFSELMICLADDPQLRTRLSLNARARAEEWFDVNATASSVNTFYRECLLENPSEKTGKTLQVNEYDPEALPRALIKTLPQLIKQGCKSIALYGAGKHTKRLLRLTKLEPLSISCIIDDKPSIRELYGIPVISPSRIENNNFDAVLISSDTYEDEMTEKAETWIPEGIGIVRLYKESGTTETVEVK